MPNILILGEAWGVEELREKTPFVGWAGQELRRMLSEAGINIFDCYLTNVFNLHPEGNKIESLCGLKSEGIEGYPPLAKGKFVNARYTSEIERLGDEICDCNPNIIIALGNTPMWAVLGRTAITKFRGAVELSTLTATGYKVLPTFHPSYIIRGAWDERTVVIMDLMKALRESEYPELRRPERLIHIPETLEDLYEFDGRYIEPADFMSVDIETAGNQVTCIGFAPTKQVGLVIPLRDYRKPGKSYWPTREVELAVWEFIAEVLSRTRPKKSFQNGMFDIAFLWRAYGIKTMGAEHDTMLLHHALQPESLKSLGFLGSLYTDEGPWKQMRERVTTIKRDE